MKLTISHTTRYAYDMPVRYALQRVRLRPQSTALQQVLDWSLTVEGGQMEAAFRDHHGNLVDLLSATPGTQEIAITAAGTIETEDTAGVFGPVYGMAPLWYFQQPTALTEAGKHIAALSGSLRGAENTVAALHGLSASILAAVPYQTGETYADTTAEEALIGGHGVCQDHAQIFVSAARLAGIPARYVSGYLMMNDRVDQDASHAWAEAHVPGLGWVGFDVSNGISPDARYVRIATGRDARDAAPISGVRMGEAAEEMVVSLQVQQ